MKKTISIILVLIIGGAMSGYLFFGSYLKNNSTGVKVESPTNRPVEKNLKLKIVAVGDSLTAGYDLPLSDSYPKILEAKLNEAGAGAEVVNAGISGETTAGLLDRAQFISDQKPDILLITTGGNDAFRNLPLKNTKENIVKSLKIFKQNIKPENIYLLQIESTANLGLNYRNDFNSMYKGIADSEKVNLLPFVVKEVFLDKSMMLPDSIHPNRAGYELIVDKYIFPAIIKKISK